ncbi:Flp pilus assembly protein TadG [Rhizobium sp. SG_E_25_P2]|jgi:Flp pilus assembly protein TadG|uniref:TadE/TadG family type IV pilus assembly protein n=1 Tax=Rhizobium sp. SG_E_25_P2 TaxID=2879942 RepID=UPI0024766BCB|nr:pilus assembly protein [Rhizobium sp. SG_E_25_P2]MDH6266754.1 Flp pilus assembly protein TadG [Rhizobium sp. SG_E_25_P2]
MLKTMLADRTGNFAMTAALLIVVMCASIGSAVDYTFALNARQKLQQAADSAAVGAIAEQSVGVLAALSNGSTGAIAEAEADAEQWFRVNTDPKTLAYVNNFDFDVTRSSTTFTSRVEFHARVPTTFLKIIGKNSIDVAGSATGTYSPVTYTDFYLMLDNSPSMGLGATTSDISLLEANNGGCAFACHIAGQANDAYALAKSIGATLRIQVVASATQSMINTAKTARRYNDQYRMALYTLGPKAANARLTEVAAMSSNLDDIKTSAGTIDLMSIAGKGENGYQQTDLLSALTTLKDTAGTGGSGLSGTDRQKVVFLVSDGVEDANRPTGCLKALSGATRCQQPIDTSVCTKIKANGVRIAVLYTTYLDVNSDSWYRKWIKPFHSEIATNMKACASDGLYFEVSPSSGVADAMNALFLKVVNMPRLTG